MPRKKLSSPEGTELRLVALRGVEVRAADDGPIGFKGHAALFDSRTKIGGKWGWYEEVAQGAFDSALSRPDDVRMLKNHNEDLILGRTTAGNLRLTVDTAGLFVDADMTPTSYATDLALSLAAGDVTQMSFAFRVLSDEWTTINAGQDDEAELRRILDVELWDVAPVTYPAYADTDASLRAREAELVCRSLGLDDPDARHSFAESLTDSTSLADVLRAAAIRLDTRTVDPAPPASGTDEPGDASRPVAVLRRRLRMAERAARVTAA